MTYIQVLRKMRGESVKQMLQNMGYSINSYPNLYRMETKNQRTSAQMRKAIAQYFDLPEDLLFDEKGFAREADLELIQKALRRAATEDLIRR